MYSSPDQTVSPYKQSRNPRKSDRPLVSQRSENLAPILNNYHGGGILHAPPAYLSSSNPPLRNQPPLLPLPIPNSGNNLRSRALSYSPVNRKTGSRSRGQSLTPKKSKPMGNPKRADSRRDSKSVKESLVIAPTGPLGPDPKDVSRVLSSALSGNLTVFTISPPPSSLPLPTFSLRPKLSCYNGEAAGIDAGATDDLQRLLRLR